MKKIFFLLLIMALTSRLKTGWAEQFTDLSSQFNSQSNFKASIFTLGYCSPSRDQEYWLIGGSSGRLFAYGKLTSTYNFTFSDLSDKVQGLEKIWACTYGGLANGSSFWLIGGENGVLNKMDIAGSFENLTGNLNFGNETIRAIGANGTYWLIGGDKGKLVKAANDGTNFTDLTSQLNFGSDSVRSLDWNGQYWLIGGENGKLSKCVSSDGLNFTFTNLSPSLQFESSSINCLKWNPNSATWLIGGEYKLKKSSDALSFSDIFSNLGLFNIWSIAFDSQTWFLAGWGDSKLWKYDGSSFENWSSRLVNWGNSGIYTTLFIPETGSKPGLVGGGKNGKLYFLDKADLGNNQKNFTDLTENISFGNENITALAWNGTYWLVGGQEGRLVKYNGQSFSEEPSQLEFLKDMDIKTMAWNGSYWLVGGNVWQLVKYDEFSTTNLSPQLANFSNRAVTKIAWNGNGKKWLIGGENGALNQYDEKNFTDLSTQLDGLNEDITSLSWGKQAWLIGSRGLGELNKYQEEKFTDLTVELTEVAGIATYIDYNGYWLLGGHSQAEGSYSRIPRLAKYNGEQFTDLSDYLLDFGNQAITCLAKNKDYWLVGGEKGSINKYDGISFTSWKSNLPGLGQKDILSLGWNGTYWLVAGKNGKIYKISSPDRPSEKKYQLSLYNNLVDLTKNEKVTLKYNLAETTHLTIKIYNLRGELVLNLLDKDETSGSGTQDWWGKNQDGGTVASGIYLIHFKAGSESEVRKVCIVK